jgi:hypothetical protein
MQSKWEWTNVSPSYQLVDSTLIDTIFFYWKLGNEGLEDQYNKNFLSLSIDVTRGVGKIV